MNKDQLIDLLTGVKSSKKTYYTELKKTIDQLKQKNMQLEIMNDLTKNIHIDMSIEEILRNVMSKLKQLITFDDCHLFILHEEEPSLLHIHPEEHCDLELEFNTHMQQLSLYTSALHGKQLIHLQVDHLPALYSEKKRLLALNIETLLLVPLYSKNEGIGVLTFGRKNQQEWKPEELDFLEQLSNQLAMTLENAALYKEVLRAKQEWEDTFKAVEDMIVVFDRQIDLYKCNDSAKNFSALEAVIDQAKPLIQDTFSSQKPKFQEILLPHDIILEMNTYPIQNKEQQVYGVIAYFKNVTIKRQIQAQLLHAGKLGAIGEMAAGVAHELNSPLTAILGNSQLLLRNTPPEHQDYPLLTDIKNCGDRCKQIVKSLLTFSRQDEYKFQHYSVNEAIHQVLNLLKFQLEKNAISIRLSLQKDLPLIVGSQPHIEQIIINLLLNAKYALDVSTSTEKLLHIQSYLECNSIIIAITDNGIGIETERLPLIFHPFHTTKERDKGTGLGLSVSLGIANDHGGTIEVESVDGHGSTFRLKLPLPNEVIT
ncbi:ATP-binding protein [Peribacillus sp. Hz7]|uniref:sensor histidine kinase n=1 Tax=Peribacillus sp. Hz7 TaxID=3344873 RepID=UPI0035CA296C